MPELITIADIAARAGVSTRMVSEALNGKTKGVRRDALERAERIRGIARRMGYRPNATATVLRTGRFGAIALLTGSRAPEYLPGELVFAADREFARHGEHLLFARVGDDQLTSDAYVPKALETWCADGLLIYYTHRFPPAMSALIDRHRIPSVWVNTRRDHDCVYLDDFDAALGMTRRMIEAGHRRVAYVHLFCDGHYSDADRRGGYEAAMKKAGLAPRCVEASLDRHARGTPSDGRFALADAMLEGPDRPTAVLAYDLAAAGPVMHAAARRGLDVPADLSLAVFGRMYRNDTGVPLTTLSDDLENVGEIAARRIREKIADPATPLPPTAVALDVLDGGSVAPPRH